MSFYAQFASHYEQVFPFRRATLEFLAARLPASGRVLDLGCGTGHHAGALAARDLEVIGVDLDEAMIASARERYGTARFVTGDLTEVASLTEYADGAYCIGNVLPHLPPDGRGTFLLSLADVLGPGAPWIVQTVNFDRLIPLQHPHDFPPLAVDGGLVFHRRYEPRGQGAIAFRTSLERDGERLFAGEATLWPLTSRDLALGHATVGIELVDELGSFGGEAFDPTASAGCVQVYRRKAGS